MSELRPCPACERHCRDEARCPFCDAALSPVPPRSAIATSGRLSRAAIFAGAALVAPACGASSSQSASSSSSGTSNSATDTRATTGRLTGTLTNARTQQPAPGEAIWIRKVGDETFERSTTTLDDGSYVFDALPPGDYEVMFPGMQSRRHREDDERGQRVKITRGEVSVVDKAIIPYDPNAPKMPYGAPPVRRRVV